MPRIVIANILLATALTVAAPSVEAQGFTGGVKAGMNMSSFQNEDYESASRKGIAIGGFVGRDISSAVGVRLEALYSMKGLSADPVTIAFDYLEVPLLVRLTLPGAVAPFLVLGPAVDVKLSAKIKGGGEEMDYGDSVHRFDTGAVVGAGLELGSGRRKVAIEARYTRGMRPVFDFGDPSDSDSDDKNQTISIGLDVSLF